MIEILETNFDKFFNAFIIDEVITRRHNWTPQIFDRDENFNSVIATNISDYCDFGMTMQYWCDAPDRNYDPFAHLIGDNILERSTLLFEDFRYVRYFWNYYNRSSYCQKHKDVYTRQKRDGENFYSMIYFVTTSDSETFFEVDGETITVPNESGTAVIFDSDITHWASSPIKSPCKISLNVQIGHMGLTKRS